MATIKPRSEWTADDYRDHTEEARRNARFTYARGRIERIVAGSPPLTDQQLADLAVLLNSGSGA